MAVPGIPVLNYHAIDPNDPTPSSPKVSVTLSSFKEHMAWLHKEGYKSVSYEDLRAVILKGKRLHDKYVLITFDDGYHSIYQYGLEILSKYGFVATIFLSTSFIGKKYDQADFEFVKHDRQLTWEEIRELSANGWSLQSHGYNHVKMTSIDHEALVNEVTLSKNIIEQNVGKTVHEFAFPYGIYNNEVITALKAAGYECAWSVHSGKLSPSSGKWHLPRIEINNMDTMDSFKVKVTTGYTSPADARRSKIRDIAFANPMIKDLIEKWTHKMGYGNR